MMTQSRLRSCALAALVLCGMPPLAAGASAQAGAAAVSAVGSALRNADVTGPPHGRHFALLDPAGQLRTLADFRGRAVLVFFGFIQCPSVCPTALARAVEVRSMLGKRANQLQVLFITLDPARDTPALMKAYTEAFDPSFLGLYTTEAHTAELAQDFKIHYRKVPTDSSYTLEHTALSYLYDPQGRLRAAIRHQASATSVAHDVRLLLQAHP